MYIICELARDAGCNNSAAQTELHEYISKNQRIYAVRENHYKMYTEDKSLEGVRGSNGGGGGIKILIPPRANETEFACTLAQM